jgi:hypothetical protein
MQEYVSRRHALKVDNQIAIHDTITRCVVLFGPDAKACDLFFGYPGGGGGGM